MYVFNKYFFMVTVYILAVYTVVKNQKSSLPSWIITFANVKSEKNSTVNRKSWETLGTYLGVSRDMDMK